MEVINYLLGYKNLRIYQDTEMFNFSLNSVLLPNFITINSNVQKIMDIGTGNAPIPLILSTKTKGKIIGVEIQSKSSQLAKKSVELNNLNEQITIINEDINNLKEKYPSEFFDIITCNPPFFKVHDNSRFNKNDYKTLARHELTSQI
ncbi:MAG: RlmF-related methyltransferase [Bacilli bacterium]